MPELRWTLLILGAIFIAVLAWWERRKRGQAPRASDEQTLAEPLPRAAREPLLTLPEIRVREHAPPEELPVVQIAADDESLMGLRIDGEPAEAGVAGEALSTEHTAHPRLPNVGALGSEFRVSDTPSTIDGRAADAPGTDAWDERPRGDLPVAHEVPLVEPVPAPGGSGPSALADLELPKLPQAEEPIVEWPPEQDRRILALRIVCMGPDRFPGRSVRTALVAEGFMLGKYSIFHKPDGEHRSVLSAASLSKPGVFDPETIDSQRFGGLSLFAVLPGPLPAREAFEDLLATARNLNERLQGGLQDERGSPLTPTRIAALRDGIGAIASAGTATSATIQ